MTVSCSERSAKACSQDTAKEGAWTSSKALTDTDKRLASADIDELNVRNDRNTWLVVDDVCPDVLSEDIERPNLSLWIEHSASGAAERKRFISLSCGSIDVALVVGPQHPNRASLADRSYEVGDVSQES